VNKEISRLTNPPILIIRMVDKETSRYNDPLVNKEKSRLTNPLVDKVYPGPNNNPPGLIIKTEIELLF
jgi:hypothetical protein